jgi:hypothetical protein
MSTDKTPMLDVKYDPWLYLHGRGVLSEDLLLELLDLIKQEVDGTEAVVEEFTDGNLIKFLSRSYVSITTQNKATDFLKELLNISFQKQILSLVNIDYSMGFSATLSMEVVPPHTRVAPVTSTGGAKDIVVLRYLVDNATTRILKKHNDTTVMTVSNGDAVIVAVNEQHCITANESPTAQYEIVLTIKTNFIDPHKLQHSSDSDIGVIIDCKNCESDTLLPDLEAGLGNITRKNLLHNGFSNIVAFSEREDFDIAVNTLAKHGVRRALVVFAGAMVGSKTLSKVIQAPHISAYAEDGVVHRKYAIFDIDKYDYFQMRGKYMSNVLPDITPNRPEFFDIALLTPDAETYRFLERIYHFDVPADVALLSDAGQGDIQMGGIILERIKEILLNTV